jgi:anti-sigma B factor antagonist
MNEKGSMVVKNVSDEIQEIFDVTGFSDILTIE